MVESVAARKSCFVIAPVEMAITSFFEELRKHHVEPFFISDLLKSGGLVVSQIRSAFRSVDFVIAFIGPERAVPNVILEIGIAVGMGRPVLLFAEQGAQIPFDLTGLTIRTVDPSNVESLIEEVDRFLESRTELQKLAFSAPLAVEQAPKRLRDVPPRAEIQRIRNISAHGASPAQLESELSRLLSSIGWTVAEARPSVRNQVPDLAVWIDEVQKDIGNPLAIEVKSSLRPIDLESVLAQVSRYLSSVGARAGIVLYAGPTLALRDNLAQTSPPIFAFSLEEFANLIERNRFPDALKSSIAAAKRAG